MQLSLSRNWMPEVPDWAAHSHYLGSSAEMLTRLHRRPATSARGAGDQRRPEGVKAPWAVVV